MTSLFFVMLVLFVLVFARQHAQIQNLKQKLAIIQAVEENLKPLKSDTALFSYEEQYKRFKLSFNVKFRFDKYNINAEELEGFYTTSPKIEQAGRQLKSIIDTLKQRKTNTGALRDVSYILVIAGYASKPPGWASNWNWHNPNWIKVEQHNYDLSYHRAWSLRDYWRSKGIDFESKDYRGLIDLQISGNGWGGVGRLETEDDNQRFLIQIFPKIGDIK